MRRQCELLGLARSSRYYEAVPESAENLLVMRLIDGQSLKTPFYGSVEDPALINSDPYGAGWLFKVAAESDGPLLSAQEYASKNGGEL